MAFLDDLKEKYEELADSFEEKGWPSPAIVFGALLVILLAASYFLFLQPQTQTISFSVKNSQGNNLAGMRVLLFDGSKQIGEKSTGDDGMVSFEKVPKKSSYTVKVTDPSNTYPALEDVVTISTTEVKMQDPAADAGQVQTITIAVYDSAGGAVRAAEVTLRFDDGSSNQSFTDRDGVASFQLPAFPDHATISVTADGFKSSTSSYLKPDLQATSGFVQITLESNEEQENKDKSGEDTTSNSYGSVLAAVFFSEDGLPVEDAQVTLLDADTSRVLKTLKTDAAGNALFDNVRVGAEFFVRVAETGKSYGYASEILTLDSADAPLDVAIGVEKKLEGSYISIVVQSDSEAISGAEVTLYDSSGKQLDGKRSDDAGKAVFSVPSRKAYYITAYADGYLPASTTARPSADVQKIELETQTEENSVEITVDVTDEGEPADAAEVLLFKSDGFALGVPSAYTQADGTAVFTVPRELDGQQYSIFAKAVRYDKRGEGSRVQVEDGMVLSVELQYEPAEIRVSLQDASSAELLSNGSVSVTDPAGTLVSTCNVDAGNCTLKAPAMTEVRLVATAEGYVQTTSSALTLNPAEKRSVKMQLVSVATARSVSAKFLGLFNGNGEVKEVGNAEYYAAKFLLTSPSSSKNVGLHAHLSGGSFVKFAEAPTIENAVVYSSSSFDSQSCYSSTGNSTSISSVDVVFPQGFTGSKEVELKLYVEPSAPASSQFSLNYKAYALKAGVPVSSPELESYEGVEAPSQALAFVQSMCKQKNFVQQVKTTASPLICDDTASFCRKLYLKAGTAVSKTSIEVAKNEEFSLVYDVLSAEAVDAIGVRTANAEFTGSSSMDFASEDAEDSGADNQAAAASEQRIPVTIEAGKRSAGSLSFKAVKAALSSDLQVTFYSESSSRAFHFIVKITGANPLKRSAPSPSQLEVGKLAKVRLKVLDERNNPVEDALVTLFDCDGAPLNSEEPQVQGDGSTDSGGRGSYAVQANPVAIGRIGVRIEHEDYRSLEECLIDVGPPSDALEAAPQSLQFKGNTEDLQPQTVTFSSSLNQRSALNVFSDCVYNDVPILSFVPASFSSFVDSAAVDVEVLPETTAKTSCRLWAEQRISSKYLLTRSVAVSIDVKAPEIPTPTPTPSPTPMPAPEHPPLPSVVFLELDSDGFAEAYYSYARGIAGCSLKGTQKFEQGTSVECAAGVIHLSADYSSLPSSEAIREAGRLTVNTDEGLARLFTVVVSREGTATPTPTAETTMAPSPTPTVVPGACSSKRCVDGRQLKCCDYDEDSEFSRAECNSKAAFDYFSGASSLEDACSQPEPLCVLSAEPQLISEPSDVSITANYYDLGEEPNTIVVDCGNGRSANLVGCAAGSCTGKCRYSAPGTFDATASVAGVECLSVQVEYSGSATPTPATSDCTTSEQCAADEGCFIDGPVCYDSPCGIDTPLRCKKLNCKPDETISNHRCIRLENPEISSPIYLNVDENGFAQKAFSFKQADVSSCELQGTADVTSYVFAECLGRTILITADYSGSNVTKSFRARGTLVLQAGEIQRKYAVIVVAANFEGGQNPDGDTTLPPLPSRLEFSVDERNSYFDYLFSLRGFGEAVSSCAVHGVDSSIAAWIQLQYCSPADQRLKVVADFSGSAYRQLLQQVYAGNPACTGYFGAPQMQYSPFLRQPYDQFGGFLPNQYGYNYADRTAFPGYNPPNYYYQYNGYSSYPQQAFYDRFYNFPPQLQYYNPNTYGRLWSSQFASTLPSYCVPTPIQGYVVFTLASGASRRIPLIITATSALQTPYLPSPLFQQTQSYVKPAISVKLDPFTLSRWWLAKESLDGPEAPQLCAIRSDASLYRQVQEGYQQGQYAGQWGQFGQQQYPDYWQQQRSVGVQQSSSRQGTTAKNLLSADDFDAESLCSRSDYGMQHEFGVDLKGSGVTARDLQPAARLNSPEEAFIDESYVRTNSHQLTPLIVTVGDKEAYNFEPLSSTLQFIVVGNSPSISGEFKLVYDLFEEDGCKVGGIKDAIATPQNVDGLPTTVAIEGTLETKKFLFNGKDLRESSSDDAEKLGVPPKSASISCSTLKGGASAKISVASFASENRKEITEMRLKDYSVPMAPDSSFAKLSGDKYYRCKMESDREKVKALADAWLKKHDDPVDAYKAYGCKIEDGKLLVNIDYEKLKTADEDAAEDLPDYFADDEEITVAVVTKSPAPSLKNNKNFEIERVLNDNSPVRLVVERVPKEEKSNQDYVSVTFKQGVSSESEVKCTRDFKPSAGAALGWPLAENVGSLSSCFGDRAFQGGSDYDEHKGVDIGADCGKEVLSASDGTASVPAFDEKGYGNWVVVTSGGVSTRYGHLKDKSIAVKDGQAVKRGQKLGLVGDTGNADGCHLHFEVREGDAPQDPLKKLTASQAQEAKTITDDRLDPPLEVAGSLLFTPTFPDGDDKLREKRRVFILRVPEGDVANMKSQIDSQSWDWAKSRYASGVLFDSEDKVKDHEEKFVHRVKQEFNFDFSGLPQKQENEALVLYAGYPGEKQGGRKSVVVRLQVAAQAAQQPPPGDGDGKTPSPPTEGACKDKTYGAAKSLQVADGASVTVGGFTVAVSKFSSEGKKKSFSFKVSKDGELAGTSVDVTGNIEGDKFVAAEGVKREWYFAGCGLKLVLQDELDSSGKPVLRMSVEAGGESAVSPDTPRICSSSPCEMAFSRDSENPEKSKAVLSNGFVLEVTEIDLSDKTFGNKPHASFRVYAPSYGPQPIGIGQVFDSYYTVGRPSWTDRRGSVKVEWVRSLKNAKIVWLKLTALQAMPDKYKAQSTRIGDGIYAFSTSGEDSSAIFSNKYKIQVTELKLSKKLFGATPGAKFVIFPPSDYSNPVSEGEVWGEWRLGSPFTPKTWSDRSKHLKIEWVSGLLDSNQVLLKLSSSQK